MIRDEIIRLLRGHADELHRAGVRHVSLFGSVARGDADAGSDVDLVVEMNPDRPLTLLSIGPLHDLLSNMLGRPVDVIDKQGLERAPTLRGRIAHELVHVF